ncbi:MAG: nitrilase-related carbon-nitrogen hydrolase [Dehalococcoidia bacterium]
MRVALIQMNATEDRPGNVDRACGYIDRAVQEHTPDLIVLPEFFNSIYFAQYRDLGYHAWAEPDSGPTTTRIREKAREHGVHIISTVYEQESSGLYYDTAMIINPDGKIVGKYRKAHPAGLRSVEKIYFRYGSKFPVFDLLGWKVGIAICYDLSFPETARILAVKGAELIVSPYCIPAGYLSSEHNTEHTCAPDVAGEEFLDRERWMRWWESLMQTRAYENVTYLAAANHVGQEGMSVFFGGTRIVAPNGETVVRAGEGDDVICASLDHDALVRTRQMTPFFRDRRPDLYSALSSEVDELHD